MEESYKLIKRLASIVKEEAKPEYVIGRIDGDSFHIIIPMAEKEEVKEYITAVKKRCFEIVDEKFFPSIAFGYEIKTNIEENIQSLLSDAEYKMFEDKYEMKHAKHYRK